MVDLTDQFRHRHFPGKRDFFQLDPKWLFKAEAGLVSTNCDGTFHNRGFHYASMSPQRCYLRGSNRSQLFAIHEGKGRHDAWGGSLLGVRRDGRRKLDRSGPLIYCTWGRAA